MNTTNTVVGKSFDSNSIFVSVYNRVAPSSKPNLSFDEKAQEYRNSVLSGKEIPLREFLSMGFSYIAELQAVWTEDDKKTRNALKRNTLPAATLSATLITRDSRLNLKDKIKHYNSLIALDFDDVENIVLAKRKIAELPYVYYVGESASRRGFFAIVPLNNNDYSRHELFFNALEKEMSKLGFKIDPACKDVTRLRFISYDPDPYFNENCQLYSLPDEGDVCSSNELAEPVNEENRHPMWPKAKAYAEHWQKLQVPLNEYNDWLTIAMSLTCFGDDGFQLLDMVSRFGKGYDFEKNRKSYSKLVATTRRISLGSFFYKCHEYGVIPPNVPHYETIPFPMTVFPPEVQEIIRQTHKCLNFSVDHISSSLLFAASIAIGNSITVEIKNEWVDKAILYIAIVGKPGTNKSAPLKYALRPLFDRDRKELKKYEKLKAAFDEAMKIPAKERKTVPVEPEYKQTVLSDFTTEVLVRQHKINPRGLCVYVDELIGFIKCFNKYRSGNDEQIWTQLYNGGSVIVNRVSSEPLNIEDTCIGVIGTIQPGLLQEFAKGKTESGFVDRWLFAYPDDSEYPKMNNEQLPKEITVCWSGIIDKIYKIPYKGNEKPVKLTRDAMDIYANWFNALADQKNVSSSSFAEMATKMERYCIRFSIVLEALKFACGKKTLKSISADSVKGGIDLCYYFIGCAQKAKKKFDSNPIEDLTEKQKKIYLELPISFTTSEGLEIACENNMSERTFKEWLKSKFFRHISHGQYEKRYK